MFVPTLHDCDSGNEVHNHMLTNKILNQWMRKQKRRLITRIHSIGTLIIDGILQKFHQNVKTMHSSWWVMHWVNQWHCSLVQLEMAYKFTQIWHKRQQNAQQKNAKMHIPPFYNMRLVVPIFSWFMCVDVCIHTGSTGERHGLPRATERSGAYSGNSADLVEKTKILRFLWFPPLCKYKKDKLKNIT